MSTASGEQALLARLQRPAQREAAFGELTREYGPALYRHLLRMLATPADVDDVLQNTFVKVFRALNDFRGESRLTTWLYRIATNEALTFLRGRKRRQQYLVPQSEDELRAHGGKADTYFDGEAAQQLLLSALEALPPKQRAVFSMRYYDELPYTEISRITGTSVGGLKASYHLAAKKIEQQLITYAAQR